MITCFENFSGNCDWDNKRNTYSSVVAGILFFTGLWLMLDTAVNTEAIYWTNFYFLLTIGSIISMFMVNAIKNSAVQGTSMDEGVFGVRGSRFWLMLGFIASFSSLVAGIWVMFGKFVFIESKHPIWPGVALFLHVFLIFIGSMVYKFGRTEELWD